MGNTEGKFKSISETDTTPTKRNSGKKSKGHRNGKNLKANQDVETFNDKKASKKSKSSKNNSDKSDASSSNKTQKDKGKKKGKRDKTVTQESEKNTTKFTERKQSRKETSDSKKSLGNKLKESPKSEKFTKATQHENGYQRNNDFSERIFCGTKSNVGKFAATPKTSKKLKKDEKMKQKNEKSNNGMLNETFEAEIDTPNSKRSHETYTISSKFDNKVTTVGDAHNIMIMVDEWKKEEEKLQKEYDNAQERIRSSLRQEHQAKAQAQNWRVRLERMGIAHKERLFRQATVLRSRLRSAEKRLLSTERRAKGLVVTNNKLKDMIDVVKEEARSLRVESEKKRESTRRELNDKLVSVESELKKLKERIVSSETIDEKTEMTNATKENLTHHGQRIRSKNPTLSHLLKKSVAESKKENCAKTPIPSGFVPNVSNYGFPPMLCNQFPTSYSRYVPHPQMSYPPLQSTYTNSNNQPLLMTPNVKEYHDVNTVPYLPHGLAYSPNNILMPCHDTNSGNLSASLPCQHPFTFSYQQVPMAQTKKDGDRSIGQQTNNGLKVYNEQKLFTTCRNPRRVPASKANRVPDDSQAYVCDSITRPPIRIPTGENLIFSTAYESGSSCHSSKNRKAGDQQQFVVHKREAYNAYEREHQAPDYRPLHCSARREENTTAEILTDPVNILESQTSHDDPNAKKPLPAWLRLNDESKGAPYGDQQSEEGFNTKSKYEQREGAVTTNLPQSIHEVTSRQRNRRRINANKTSSESHAPSGAESAPTPYQERGYLGDFERSASTLEVVKRRRIVRRHERIKHKFT